MPRPLPDRLLSIAFVAAFLAPHPAVCQRSDRDRTGRLGIAVGVLHQGIADVIASPLRQTGGGADVSLRYRSVGRAGTWGVEVGYAGPTLRPAGVHTSEAAHEARLGFDWQRAVYRSGDDGFVAFAGAGTRIQLIARTHDYTQATELFADLFAPVELRGSWTRQLGPDGGLEGGLAVAVLSLAMRDPWSGLKRVPDLEVLDPVRAPMLRHVLAYRRRLGPAVDAVVAHELSYLRYPEPRRLVVASQSLSLALEWRP